uniref:PP1-binding domain-containing protein n=1 Tax=Poecilia reticulata TaxID=8081 RepID=A0A3P9PZP7_POERE
MSTDQAVTKVPVGDQENMSPVQEDALAVMNEISTPLNFSKLTPGQFGISVESFIPSSSNCKDKSRLAQIKSRRRSGIGARGSPETNSLIRFRAQQGMKTPPASRTPEAVKSSPVFPRVPSTLRQKMASFQSLMDVVESDGCDPTPAPDGDAAGRISDRDYPSGEAAPNADETPAVKKKKQVRFGGPLSPEFFDKNLPPSTPLKKGGTPARAATPGGGLQPRSVLKTPQRSDSEDQLDLLSLAGFGASPTFSMSHKNRVAQEREDDEDGKVCAVASSAAHRWNKDVDYSLYGSREYASKNPTLSPITERLSFIQRTSARQQTLESPTDCGSLQKRLEVKQSGNFSIKSVSLPSCSPERNNRQPRITAKRVRKKRKVSVADCEVLREEITEQQLEVDVSQGTLSTFTKSEQREADPEEPSADILCTDSSKSKYDASTLTPTSSYAPLGEDSSKAKPAKKQAKQGRRSSALLEPHQAGEHQPDCEGNGNQEEERGPIVDLAPWQAHFNFEDVFKPVATRRQRSVRRSLRSQVNSEHVTTGLAWVPHTSPESIKETRRRTRHRRLSATLPVQPALPEEAQDSSSSQWTPGKL